MSEIKRPEPLKWSHCAGYIYLTFTHATDGDFSEEEYHACVSRVNSWTPEGKTPEGADVMTDVLNWYNSVPKDWSDEDRLNERIKTMLVCADMIKEQFNESVCNSILNDLEILMKADGQILDSEKKWLEKSC